MTKQLLTLDDIKAANRRAGKYWFSADTLRFFRSRISETVYPVAATGGALFISSERFDESSPRLFTVRYASPTGDISTMGEFQQYRSRSGAHLAAQRLQADGNCPTEGP